MGEIALRLEPDAIRGIRSAGVAALYISVFGGRKEHKTTSNLNFVAPPVQMGSGLFDAVHTLYAKTTLDQTQFNLDDTANFQLTHDLSITNHGTEAVMYNFTPEPAAGFESLDPYIAVCDTWGIKTFDNLVPIQMAPDVKRPEAVEVAAGETRKVTVTFTNPEKKAGTLRSLSGVNWMNIDEDATYNFDPKAESFNWLKVSGIPDWAVHELRWDSFESDWDKSHWTYQPRAPLHCRAWFGGPRSALDGRPGGTGQ
ncbi:uncharacterized protein PG986_014491 [Apiospora aurea]|uniref:Uncharacterized protein n=1 Tax=Apiospora aurea TaxID=335848 RepID=A0ABR1PT59_9PEZI